MSEGSVRRALHAPLVSNEALTLRYRPAVSTTDTTVAPDSPGTVRAGGGGGRGTKGRRAEPRRDPAPRVGPGHMRAAIQQRQGAMRGLVQVETRVRARAQGQHAPRPGGHPVQHAQRRRARDRPTGRGAWMADDDKYPTGRVVGDGLEVAGDGRTAPEPAAGPVEDVDGLAVEAGHVDEAGPLVERHGVVVYRLGRRGPDRPLSQWRRVRAPPYDRKGYSSQFLRIIEMASSHRHGRSRGVRADPAGDHRRCRCRCGAHGRACAGSATPDGVGLLWRRRYPGR